MKNLYIHLLFSQSGNKRIKSQLLGLLYALIFPLMLSNNVNAQTTSYYGLNLSELNGVIQNCIDLQALQQYYPLNTDGSLKQVNIRQYPITFPAGTQLSKGGNVVNLLNASESTDALDAYFMFRSIETSQNTLTVKANYFYKDNSQMLKTVSVTINFQNANSSWTISNFNLTGDTL